MANLAGFAPPDLNQAAASRVPALIWSWVIKIPAAGCLLFDPSGFALLNFTKQTAIPYVCCPIQSGAEGL